MFSRGCLLLGLILAWAVVGATGCAEEEPTPTATTPAGSTLTAAEQEALRGYDRVISKHCARVSGTLVDPTAGPTPEQEEEAFAAADALIALAAAKPTAPLGAGQDTRLFLSDVIENLGGSNCDPRMVAVLGAGLAEIPVGP